MSPIKIHGRAAAGVVRLGRPGDNECLITPASLEPAGNEQGQVPTHRFMPSGSGTPSSRTR